MESHDQSEPLPASQLPGSYQDRLLTARGHVERGELADAAAIYVRLVDRLSRLPERRRQPGSALAGYLVAAAGELHWVRAAQGRYEEADQLCRHLERWDAEDVDYWRRRCHLLRIEQGDLEGGLSGLRGLAEAEPHTFGHWIVLAQQGIANRHFEEAEKALDRALALVTADDEATALVYFNRFQLLRQQQRWIEAGEAWAQATARDKDLETTRELVVRMFIGAGLLDQAGDIVDDDAMTAPIADHYRALLAFRRGDKVRARYLWRQVIDADADRFPEAQIARALAFCWLGQPLQALSVLLREVQIGRELGYRHALTLALAWAMEGKLDTALSNLSVAEKQRPQGPDRQFSQLDWYDFDNLVGDEAIKDRLRGFFVAG